MDELRKAGVKDFKVKDAWKESIHPLKEVISKRFERLALKDEPVRSPIPVTNDEITFLRQLILNKFPRIDINKLRRKEISKVVCYQEWLEQHSRQRHYCFQLHKCGNIDCCTPSVLPPEKLHWLPDPVHDESKEHFNPFLNLYGTDTSESDRPSLKPAYKQVTVTRIKNQQRTNLHLSI